VSDDAADLADAGYAAGWSAGWGSGCSGSGCFTGDITDFIFFISSLSRKLLIRFCSASGQT
jgi:hypothetical protein